ncbi:MAG: tripartite tricarboxylate transporter substrate binding protein [Betaproteobacteria bacterium]|nr:tripartite tricarboxylate transporter substrate binding protein [Betaproteobacteria bacterium]
MLFHPVSFHRGSIVLALLVASAAPGAFAQAPADTYPGKPIRLIVPFAPGGGTDITARTIAQKLTERSGQQVIVDNRPGANGTIGVDIASKSAPDGYTLSMISSSHSVNVSLYKKLPYDLANDLAPITQATSQPYALVVHPSVPAKSVKELVALARAKPGTLNYGSSGTGGLSHLSGALLGSLAKVDIVHIPYKGGSPAMTDVIAGQIQMLFSTILQSHAHLKSGKLRGLAVTTAKRSPAEPNLPTMQEAGVPGYEVAGWYGVVAPAKVPQPILAKLNREIVEILRSPDVGPRLAADGSEPVGSTREAFGAHIRSEIAKWNKLVKEANIRAE